MVPGDVENISPGNNVLLNDKSSGYHRFFFCRLVEKYDPAL